MKNKIIFKQRTFEKRSKRDIMKENSYTYEEGMRMDKQFVAIHCLKEDIEGTERA